MLGKDGLNQCSINMVGRFPEGSAAASILISPNSIAHSLVDPLAKSSRRFSAVSVFFRRRPRGEHWASMRPRSLRCSSLIDLVMLLVYTIVVIYCFYASTLFCAMANSSAKRTVFALEKDM
jgi:hypothetical protein